MTPTVGSSAAFTVVYLHVTPEVLAERVVRDPARPWLDDDPLSWIQRTYVRRDPVFRRVADHTVDNEGPLDLVARRVLALLGTMGS